MGKTRFTLLLILGFLSITNAQKTKSSAEIFEGFKKLKVLGSVLYIAAHPDDENTRLITYLANDKKLQTAYLSLTRGDGGQNLIGPELDEYLGVIRTNELLQARRIDGGIQFFTRANDFGYSKNAEETFSIWNKDSILLDVIRVIREYKPDIIINRFDHRTSGRTHGHHTASAVLGLEAAQHSNSPLFMRNSLQGTEGHIVQRTLFNTSYFFYGGKEKFDAMDKSQLYLLDAGSYYPAYGYSNNEIAAQSRSMHKSQGFGINSSRGSMMEYFERIDGTKDPSHQSPLDGLLLNWSRINGGGNVEKLIDSLILQFNLEKPWLSIPLLQKIESFIQDLPRQHWTTIKLEETRQLIFDCAGLFAECSTDKNLITGSSKLNLLAECILRNPVVAKLRFIRIPICGKDTSIHSELNTNKSLFWNTQIEIPAEIENTCPFWLLNGRQKGFYRVDSLSDFSRPVNERKLKVEFEIQINNSNYIISKEIIYKNDDPVSGEVKQNLDIIPSTTIVPDDPLILINQKAKKLKISLHCHSNGQRGILSLRGSDHIQIQPEQIPFSFSTEGEKKEFEFEVTFKGQQSDNIDLKVFLDDRQAFTLETIRYPHIPWLNILLPAKITLIPVEKPRTKKRIAYVDGAGDFIDDALIKLGFEIKVIKPEELNNIPVNDYDVLVFGIRALNVNPGLKNCKVHLDKFMRQGGKVIFQYNTTAELVTDDFAPSPMKITRDRVTDESAPVKILLPDHPLLHIPNKIESKDFDKWIQERGLYFPANYDSSYQEIISMSDPNEKELKSGILTKQVGKGWFVYTPLSWFRQLKSGVPGAYRLFTNLICF